MAAGGNGSSRNLGKAGSNNGGGGSGSGGGDNGAGSGGALAQQRCLVPGGCGPCP
jgi:hypothetical protein